MWTCRITTAFCVIPLLHVMPALSVQYSSTFYCFSCFCGQANRPKWGRVGRGQIKSALWQAKPIPVCAAHSRIKFSRQDTGDQYGLLSRPLPVLSRCQEFLAVDHQAAGHTALLGNHVAVTREHALNPVADQGEIAAFDKHGIRVRRDCECAGHVLSPPSYYKYRL